MTRGPLPARVYWVRRLMVLGTAVLLVVAIGRLLGEGSDASSSGDDGATTVAADTSPSTTYTEPVGTPTPRKQKTPTLDPTPTLAVPVGECDGTDVAVTPEVTQAVAGRDVTIVLQLRTLEAEACTWAVGPRALTLDITSGKDDIWTSRDCPGRIPKEPVVVRQAVTSTIEVVWNSRRSDEDCTRLTSWAMPGWYHVSAAALGGEPSDLQFQLTTPTAATITRTATPKQSPTQKPSERPSQKPTHHGSGRPVTSQSPSGAVEPSGR